MAFQESPPVILGPRVVSKVGLNTEEARKRSREDEESVSRRSQPRSRWQPARRLLAVAVEVVEKSLEVGEQNTWTTSCQGGKHFSLQERSFHFGSTLDFVYPQRAWFFTIDKEEISSRVFEWYR